MYIFLSFSDHCQCAQFLIVLYHRTRGLQLFPCVTVYVDPHRFNMTVIVYTISYTCLLYYRSILNI